MCAPKGVGPLRLAHFSCKAAASEGAEVGTMSADSWTPADASLPARLRGCREQVAKAMSRCGSTSGGARSSELLQKADEFGCSLRGALLGDKVAAVERPPLHHVRLLLPDREDVVGGTDSLCAPEHE